MAVKVKPPEEPLLNEMPPENLNGKNEKVRKVGCIFCLPNLN